MDGNGKIDVTDLSYLSIYLIGEGKFTDDQMKAADVDCDGGVKLSDLARLRQYLSRIEGVTLGPKK